MRIGFDVDGVLYPFEDCFRNWMQARDPEAAEQGVFDPPATKWSFYEDWGMSLEEFKKEMADAAFAGHLYRSRDPYVGAVAVLGWCRSHGHTVHLVTHRAERGAMANTEAWLARQNIPHDTVTFAHDKSIIDADVLIEDRPENLQVWIDRAGKPGIIFTRPWNEDWDHDAAGAIRVWTYEQLRHVLRSIEIGLKNDAITEEIAVTAQHEVPTFTRVETVLEEANRLIYGARHADYGHPLDDFTKVTGMINALFADKIREPFVAEDWPLIMQMVKMSRERNAPKRDNRVDGPGYWGTLQMVIEERDRRGEAS